jgi:acyl carrier protein
MDKLLKILTGQRPDVDFEKETKLIDHNILDSFDIISIVGEINDVFNISINAADIKNENFNSAPAILALIKSCQSR